MLVVCTALPALALDKWPAVVRPGVNAGTGTADYTVDLFAPVYQTDSSMFFLAPRFRINPGLNDENEFNVGLGYRKLIRNDSWFVGGNVYYDTMSSANNNRFNQIGLGLEARSKWLDVILNGYIPFGKTTRRATSFDLFRLSEHDLLRRTGVETAMSGVDGEVGVLVPGISNFLETRAYVGGYWWTSGLESDVTGVRGRVEIDPVPLVTANGIYSWDHVRGSIWRGEAYLNIPFSVSNLVEGKNPFAGLKNALKFGQGAREARARMTDRVERDRYIQTQTGTETDWVTDHPMIYVNNANAADTSQDGSLTHPFSELVGSTGDGKNAQDAISANTTADPPYVYVFAGTGDSYAGGFDFSYDVAGRSGMLWGEHYMLPGMSAGMTAGPWTLTGAYPYIYGGSFGVGLYTDGGNLTVRGVRIENAGNVGQESYGFFTGYGDGVIGIGLHNADIEDNVIRYCSGDGVELYAGDSIATAGPYGPSAPPVTYDVNITVKGNTIDNNDGTGVYYDADKYNSNGNINVDVSDNASISNNRGSGIYGEAYNWGDGNINVTMDNNIAVNDNGAGAKVTPPLTAGPYGQGGDGYGIYTHNEIGGTGDLKVDVSNNTANGNYYDNIHAYAYSDYGTGNMVMRVNNNTANDSYDGTGIYVKGCIGCHSGPGNVSVTVNGNTANDNGYEGIDVTAKNNSTGDGSTTLVVSGNTANNNGDYGIDAYAENSVDGKGDATLFVTDNTANNNYGYNIYAEADNYASGDGSTTVVVSGNTANDCNPWESYYWDYYYYYYHYDGYGIYAEAYNDVGGKGDAVLTVTGNTASGNTGYGIYAEAYNYASGDGSTTLTVSGNTANDTKPDDDWYSMEGYGAGDYYTYDGTGIYAYAYNDVGGNGNVTATVSGNTANNNTGYNIDAEAYNYSSGNGNTTLTVTGNTANDCNPEYENDYGYEYYYDGRGMYVEGDNDISGATGEAVLTVSGNTVNNNYDEGIYIDYFDNYAGTGSTTVTVANNTANYNGDDGIYVDEVENETDTGNLNVAFTGNTTNYNDGDGIDISYLDNYSTGGAINVNIAGNTANYNSGDGIYLWMEHDDPGAVNVTISGNTASYNDGYGIYADVYLYDDNTTNVTVTGNTANYNTDDNIYAYIYNDGYNGDSTLNVTNNQASYSSDGDGIQAEVYNDGSDSGNATLNVSGNTADYNEYYGVYAEAYNYNTTGSTSVTVDNNTASFSNNGDDGDAGIYVYGYNDTDTGNLTMNVSNNTANYNYYYGGIEVYGYDYATGSASLTMNGNTANYNNGGDGIYAYLNNANGGGNASLAMSNNTALGNDSWDLYMYAHNTGGLSTDNVVVSGAGNSIDDDSWYADFGAAGSGTVTDTLTPTLP